MGSFSTLYQIIFHYFSSKNAKYKKMVLFLICVQMVVRKMGWNTKKKKKKKKWP